MAYVDGFLAAVPENKKDAFLAHAKIAGEIFRECGALNVVECWADDVPDGKVTSMPMAVKAGPGEVVAFSWIVWPDKATRDAGFQKMMEDPRMSEEANPMPFDGKRMIFGGFSPILGEP